MKDIRMALRAMLLGDATISGLVGGFRIHDTRLPQGQKDASVVYNWITETGHYHMNGDSGLGEVRFQLDSWATRADSAVELANAVYDRLSGFRGTVLWGANSPQEQIEIQGAFLASGREGYDAAADMYVRGRDYIIWYGHA